jgi:hypothetical protein
VDSADDLQLAFDTSDLAADLAVTYFESGVSATLKADGTSHGSRPADGLTEADRRALSPLFWTHVDPYGRFELDMNSRLDFGPADAVTPGPRRPQGESAPSRRDARRARLLLASPPRRVSTGEQERATSASYTRGAGVRR